MQGRNRFQYLVIFYISWIAIWLLTRWVFQDKFWLFAIINMGAEYYFVPLPFLLGIALYQKHKKAFLWLTIPVFIFLSFWGMLYLPKFPPEVSEGSPPLKVMTYNVLVSNQNPQQVVEVVMDEFPDIVGFQELSKHNIPPLDEGFRDAYPYNTFEYFSGQRSDVGLVSRYPILSVERFSFPPEERAMHTIVDRNGHHVHIFIVHFSANNLLQQSLAGAPALAIERFGYRSNQVQRISEEISNITEPILVLCDCNLLDTSATYASLASMFTDSFRESGWGSGHTALFLDTSFPYQRIDYIWHSSEFISVTSHVGKNYSSDHLPLISTLWLQPTE